MWQSGISECFACKGTRVLFQPALVAAFPEVAVFAVVMGEFLDLASWSAVMQWTCEFFEEWMVTLDVGHESLPYVPLGPEKVVRSLSSLTSV